VADEEEYCVCDHAVSHKDERLWLKPPLSERKHSPQQPRLYCKKCGRIKYQGSAIAKDLGFYVNLLKEIQQKVDALYRRKQIRCRMTQAQIRLIVNALKEDDDFLDTFSNQMYTQYDFFKQCVRKYCDIDEYIIDSMYEQMK
jgi:hypothetical protein